MTWILIKILQVTRMGRRVAYQMDL